MATNRLRIRQWAWNLGLCGLVLVVEGVLILMICGGWRWLGSWRALFLLLAQHWYLFGVPILLLWWGSRPPRV